jgi:hypothetical protein
MSLLIKVTLTRDFRVRPMGFSLNNSCRLLHGLFQFGFEFAKIFRQIWLDSGVYYTSVYQGSVMTLTTLKKYDHSRTLEAI